MADYYPLLAKAVSGLKQSNVEQRRAIYERARKALLGQLKAIQPPIAEADIARENEALDAAIARLESEMAAPTVVEDLEPPSPEPVAPGIATAGLRPGFDPSAASNGKPVEADDFDRDPRPIDEPQPLDETETNSPSSTRAHPAAPIRKPETPGARRLWILGGVIAGFVMLVALAAIALRNKPEDLGALKAANGSSQTEQPASNKIGGRAAGGEAATAPSVDANARPNAAIPVSQHAYLLIEAPETEAKVKTFSGSVVWRFDTVARGAGQPLGAQLKADVDVPEAGLRMTFDMQKNGDSTLSASHTIELRFITNPSGEAPGVRQVGVIQMRREEARNGDSLNGLPVPITNSIFLIGLARGDLEKRNLELLRTRGWVDIPFALTNGRAAKLTLEKGAAGDRAFNDALTAWDKQN